MLRPCGPCVPFFAVILFPFLVILFVLITTFSLVFGIFCAVPASMGCCCLYSWRCSKRWQTDLYQKVIYLSYYLQNRGLPQPKANSKFLPVEDIRPKQVLESLGFPSWVGDSFVKTHWLSENRSKRKLLEIFKTIFHMFLLKADLKNDSEMT